MALPWLRLYTEFATDPKIQILAFDDQRHFVMLLCLKGSGVLDSVAPNDAYRERLIAKALGLDPTISSEVKRRLVEGGLITPDWQPLAWENRQFASDSAADRMRKYREKLRSNVTVTPPLRNGDGPDSDTDTDSDTDSDGKKKSVELVFEHWQKTWNHPRAKLDAKLRRVITERLKEFDEADLCQAITGYTHSPHHCGQNDRNTVYDSLSLFLRDAAHVNAGLKFYASPPRAELSNLTKRNVAATADWQPPELRHATQ